ncbi:MAG: nucleotidyltransferase domain-containing protein [Ignavibacteriaceae bacterium]|nr:nucleotidyltransferase domain-containing protein [Ignavibacteriaceae bacterium]
MRLNDKEIIAIRSVVKEFDPKAEIKLFGSRIDDNKKGGDIDLLIISNIINFSEKLSILIKLKENIGDQKIDILIYDPNKTFHNIAYKEGVTL